MAGGRLYKLKIIFEDNHLLVVEKPVNIPSQQDESGDPDMLTLLKEDIKQRYNKPGNVFLGLVHRLDRPVGGVMVFARTSKAASRLSEQVRSRTFKKNYLAVIHGFMDKQEGTLKNYLLKDNDKNIVKAVDENAEGSKLAVLDYMVVSSCQNLSLVKINLHTGRSHQIRVQFAETGHSLFGDRKYGSKLSKDGQQLALWSHELVIEHPTLKTELKFESSPPDVVPWSYFKY